MKNKLRFHIRLIFGVEQQQQQSQDSSNRHQNDNDDDDSLMDGEGSYNHGMHFQSWIPASRLFPNRSNNRGADKLLSTESSDIHYQPTPHYNNALSESLHLQSTTNLISDTIIHRLKNNIVHFEIFALCHKRLHKISLHIVTIQMKIPRGFLLMIRLLWLCTA